VPGSTHEYVLDRDRLDSPEQLADEFGCSTTWGLSSDAEDVSYVQTYGVVEHWRAAAEIVGGEVARRILRALRALAVAYPDVARAVAAKAPADSRAGRACP